MRKERLIKNTITSLLYQVTTIVCGFILPRAILKSFGSEVNGLVNSITQFLGFISFLELGVGAVVRSALYKPLADNDSKRISEILSSATKYFSLIGKILFVYLGILLIAFPIAINSEFTAIYIDVLLVIISISFFAQYYLGIVDSLLLTADQKGFIVYITQTITTIINTIVSILLIFGGLGIHAVKLSTSLIYLARPLVIRWYITKHYRINRKAKYDKEPLEQKWNGISQHIAFVLLDGTDTIILTLFSTLSTVSIYSVYHLVVYGVKQLFTAATNGIQSLLGDLWARNETENLKRTFSWTEWLIHTGSVLVFGCTAVLIVPFIQIYTYGVNDANYVQPAFAILITIAHGCHCLRLPYHTMIMAANKYKDTQNIYTIAALLNIIVSIATVKIWGLIGVAIGTLASMFLQTIWMAWYNTKNLIKRPLWDFAKQIFVDIVSFIIGYSIANKVSMGSISYLSWGVLALKTVVIFVLVVFIVNSVVYRNKMTRIFRIIIRR